MCHQLRSNAVPRKPSVSIKVVQDPKRSVDLRSLTRPLLFDSLAAEL
jgi:hypothetical protein